MILLDSAKKLVNLDQKFSFVGAVRTLGIVLPLIISLNINVMSLI